MKSRPKILHVITGLQVGGAEMMLVKTLPRLQGYEHTVCTVLHEGPLAEALRQGGVRVVSLNLRKSPLRGLARFRRLLGERPDLCISYLIHADLFVRLFGTLFGLRRQVVFIRNNLVGSKYHRLLSLERRTNRRVQAYLSVSASVARIYQERMGYDPEKFQVIPNGIEVEKFSGAKALDRDGLGIKDGQLAVLMVAKFYEQKGHRYLVEAWKEVAARHPEAVLLLVGGGPLRDEVEGLVAEAGLQGSVRFLGVRDDVPRLLKTADVFVFPTLFEGMSNALLEAMAAGCAIVTTGIPENREVAGDDEAVFVPPADAPALAKALDRVLGMGSEARHDLGTRAFAKVKARFSIEATVAILDDAYKKLINA